MGEVEFFGVRHHSPTAARLVAERIRKDPPAAVLVEGPSEFNDRLEELNAPHRLPIMIYTWAPLYPDADPGSQQWAARRGGYYPLTDFSPEWTALQVAWSCGVPASFIDLPWLAIAADTQRENRFAEPLDGDARHAQSALLAALGTDSLDTAFDEALDVAADLDLETYLERIEILGALLRGEADPETRLRESFMAARIREARDQNAGRIMVVCGAAHLAGLRAELTEPTSPPPAWTPPPDDDRYGIALAPTSYIALDALDGYNAGQPTPGFYDALWHDRAAGRTGTGQRILTSVLAGLRQARQQVSTADVIATLTAARGLAAIRGHEDLWRTDLIDAMTTTLVKDDSGAEHPLLHHARLTMRGNRLGQLAPGTPQPPLVTDIHTALDALDLRPDVAGRDITVDLTDPVELRRSRLLHGLRLLGVNLGVLHNEADEAGIERWRVQWSTELEADLVAAARFGATVEDALTTRITDEASDIVGDPVAAARLVLKAALCGVTTMAASLQHRLDELLATCGEFTGVAEALAVLMRLYRYDPLLRATGRTDIAALLTTGFHRCVRLAERLPRRRWRRGRSNHRRHRHRHRRARTHPRGPQRGPKRLGCLARSVGRRRRSVGRGSGSRAGRAMAYRGGARRRTGGITALGTTDGTARRPAGGTARRRPRGRTASHGPHHRVGLDPGGSTGFGVPAGLAGLRRAFSRYPPRERAHIAQVILGDSADSIAALQPTSHDVLAVAAFESRLVDVADRYLGCGVVL